VIAPEISVVIPCHNSSSVLGLQLDSLYNQRDAPAFEVIVVDNRSTDGLVDVVDRWHGRWPSVRLVSADAESGVSYARNVGADAARSTLLMFCDADDVTAATWVRQGLRNFEYADLWSGAAIPVVDSEFGMKVADLRLRIGDTDEWRPLVDDQDTAFPILMGGNFGVTKELFFELGGFDQSLPLAGEDNDFAVRARRAGQRIPVSPTARIAYRIRSNPAERRRQQYRAGVAHGLIATRFDLWKKSPFPGWWDVLGRSVGALVRMCLPGGTRDWPGLSERFSVGLGLAHGAIKYRYLRRVPPQRVGVGLSPLNRPGGEGEER